MIIAQSLQDKNAWKKSLWLESALLEFQKLLG
jgi:hypothetical protein